MDIKKLLFSENKKVEVVTESVQICLDVCKSFMLHAGYVEEVDFIIDVGNISAFKVPISVTYFYIDN